MTFHFDDIMLLKDEVFKQVTQSWDSDVRNFWAAHIDRLYEFYILPKIMQFTSDSKVLEIGAEYYSRHIKSVFNDLCSLSLLDIKPPSHPDIKTVLNVDRFINLDLTDMTELYSGEFDFIISFGVLSHYNFSELQCKTYLDNLVQMLKLSGTCAIKIDVQIMQGLEKFNDWEKLHLMIKKRFLIETLHVLHDKYGVEQFMILYCRKK